ncbi:MAG: mitochondrial small ribosomal subunit Rsm22-domain-containing protein, partial [Monoraphidium minutum]
MRRGVRALLLAGRPYVLPLDGAAGAAFSTRVVPAEVARQVAQRWQGLVRLPRDVLEALTSYFADSGLRKRSARQRVLALTEDLQQLSRSAARGGIQPYRRLPGGAEAAAAAAGRQLPGGGGWEDPRAAPRRLGPGGGGAAEGALVPAQQSGGGGGGGGGGAPAPLGWGDAAGFGGGGGGDLMSMRTRSGRVSAQALALVDMKASVSGPLSLTDAELRAWAGLPPPLGSSPEEEAARAAAPTYSLAQAQAYALSRLAGTNAALAHVFQELAARLPGFAPRAMLDYGAGPGTAVWAAHEVWPDALALAHAIEPSPHMARLGRRLEAARREAAPSAPLVRWHPDLASLAGVPGAPRGGAAYGSRRRVVAGYGRGSRRGPRSSPADDASAERSLGFARGLLASRLRRLRRRYDCVVGSYVLSEVAGPRERAALVARLWSLTGGVLVLVEPGTPAGFANIAEARAAVLTAEGRKAAKAARRAAAAAADGGPGPDANLASKLRRYGAPR